MRRCFRLLIAVTVIISTFWVLQIYLLDKTAPDLKFEIAKTVSDLKYKPGIGTGFSPPSLQLSVSEGQPKIESSSWALNPSWDLLLDVLKAIGKIVDFCETQVSLLNLDGILGLRVVDDQFSLLLERYTYPSDVDSTDRRGLLTTVNILRWRARNALEAAIFFVNITQFEYFQHVGSIVRKGQWAIDYPLRSLQEVVQTPQPQSTVSFNFHNSDTCISEIVGVSRGPNEAWPPCNMSDWCWRTMIFPNVTDYSLTHQLLFLEMGEIAGCGRFISNFAQTYGQGSMDVIRNSQCSRILSEAKSFQSGGYSEDLHDLFMEQILLCGILGYQEFLTEDWLSEILTWQDTTGCYKMEQRKGKRVKRHEREISGGCGSHKTSVALGALTIYARFILLAVMETNVSM